jgi:tRNA threonylcarbamoyladenosine biosynthesis protein TsaE
LKAKRLHYTTTSGEETIRLGEGLGKRLQAGDHVALLGPLGSGKTWFTKGLALGLGVSRETVVTSPSFALVNDYRGRLILYHMDLYRLETLSDILGAGLEEYVLGNGIAAVEWADRWPALLNESRIVAAFSVLDEHRRRIELTGRSSRAAEILAGLEKNHPPP